MDDGGICLEDMKVMWKTSWLISSGINNRLHTELEPAHYLLDCQVAPITRAPSKQLSLTRPTVDQSNNAKLKGYSLTSGRQRDEPSVVDE